MVDNIAVTAGTGTTIATDDIAGVQVQRVKLTWGVDGTMTDANATTPLPVVQTGTPALPTGAATAAKQPALGTAGTASADVISVQGIASGTEMAVSAASLPLPTGAATDAKLDTLIALFPATTTYVSGAITTAMTATTSTSLLAAPGVGKYNYITTIVVSNAHATVGTDVIIQDGSAGTTLMTIPAAAVYGGATITLPTPLKQPTANTALYCANVTTGASTTVSCVGYTGA